MMMTTGASFWLAGDCLTRLENLAASQLLRTKLLSDFHCGQHCGHRPKWRVIPIATPLQFSRHRNLSPNQQCGDVQATLAKA
jgi:hypothetical protein